MNSVEILPGTAHNIEQILDNMSDGYVVYDSHWRLCYINGKGAELINRPKDELQGKTLFELFPGIEADPAFAHCETLISRKQQDVYEYYNAQIAKWLSVKVIPVESGIVCYFTDITERKKLEQNSLYLESITDSLNDALLSTDKQYRIISWNPAAEKLYGWKEEEAVGKNAEELLKTVYGPGLEKQQLLDALKTNGWWEGEVKQSRKDGTQLEVLSHVSALRNERNELIGIVGLNRNLTFEKKAREAQMQLSAIVESSQDAIISKNLKGFIKTWNCAAEKIFGYSATEMIGRHITTLIPPELIYEEDEIIGKIKKGIQVKHFETVRVRKDGSRVNISLTISPIRDLNGEIIGASKIARDITEKTQAEKALRDSEEQLRAMFNQAGVGVSLIDTDCRMLEVNPKFCEILGYSESELLNTSCLDKTHPDDRAMNQKILDELANSTKETATFEKRYVTKSGLHVWVRVTIAKIHDQNHSIQQYVAIVEDISETKRAEAGLRESESRFRILAENIQSMAWMANPDGWIFWCNQRWYEYLGSSFETIKGWGWEQTLHPDHFERVHQFLSSAWKSGEPWEITFPLKGKNGDYRWFLTSAYPVRDGNGELLRWIGTCTDVNALKNQNRQGFKDSQ